MGGVEDTGHLALALVMANAGVHLVLAVAFRLRTDFSFGQLVTQRMRLFFLTSFLAWLALAAEAFLGSQWMGLVAALMLILAATCFLLSAFALVNRQPRLPFWLIFAAFMAFAIPLAMSGAPDIAESVMGVFIGAAMIDLYRRRRLKFDNSAMAFFALLGISVLLASVGRASAILLMPGLQSEVNAIWLMLLSGFSNLSIIILLLAVNQSIQNILNHQALTDPLTGLMNRRALLKSFRNVSGEIKRKPIQLGLIICDLDHFKRVNDVYGHDIGDGVLIAFAGVLRRATRSSDIMARFGGEEFVVLMQEATPETLAVVANRICEETRRHDLRVGEVQVSLSVSIGAGLFRGIENFDEAFTRVDAALYEAKETGRDRVVFASEMEIVPK